MKTRFLSRMFKARRPRRTSQARIPTTFGQRLDAARSSQPEFLRTIEGFRYRTFG
jgi:hypothetical protein